MEEIIFSKEFSNFCQQAGIQRQKTQSYTPQQNDVVERRNRSIMSKVRAMLLSSKINVSVWGEAMKTSIYLLNRSPTKTNGSLTPKELFTGQIADLPHLCVLVVLVLYITRVTNETNSVKGQTKP